MRPRQPAEMSSGEEEQGGGAPMQLWGGGCSRPAGRGEGPSMQVWLGVSEGRHEVLGAPTPRKRVLLRQACTSEGQHCPQLQPLGKNHAHRATRGTGNPRRRGIPCPCLQSLPDIGQALHAPTADAWLPGPEQGHPWVPSAGLPPPDRSAPGFALGT